MQKTIFLILIFFSINSFANNSIISFVDQLSYGQEYCAKNISVEAKQYIQKNMIHAIDYCIDEDQSNNPEYQRDLEKLFSQAKNDPKKYDYYIAYAYLAGLGVGPNLQLAGDWLEKSSQAGNEKAIYLYSMFQLKGNSDECNKNTSECFKRVTEKLEKMQTVGAYETLAPYASSASELSAYNKKAVELGSVDAYPAYVTCYQDLENKPMTKQMRERLSQIFSDPSISIYTKAAVADLLGKKKVADLLYSAVQ